MLLNFRTARDIGGCKHLGRASFLSILDILRVQLLVLRIDWLGLTLHPHWTDVCSLDALPSSFFPTTRTVRIEIFMSGTYTGVDNGAHRGRLKTESTSMSSDALDALTDFR